MKKRGNKIPWTIINKDIFKNVMKLKEYDQQRLATEMDYTVDTIKRITRKNTTSIDSKLLEEIARTLDVSFSLLLGDDWQNPALVKHLVELNPKIKKYKKSDIFPVLYDDEKDMDYYLLPYREWDKEMYQLEAQEQISLKDREDLFIKWLSQVPYDKDDYIDNTDKQMTKGSSEYPPDNRFPYDDLHLPYRLLEDRMMQFLFTLLPSSTQIQISNTPDTLNFFREFFQEWDNFTEDQQDAVKALIETFAKKNKEKNNG